MRQIGIVRAMLILRRVVLSICCLLGLAQAAFAQTVAATRDLPEAVIAYGFLSSNYADFDKLLASGSTFAVAHDMKALQNVLDSLDCDLVIRLQFSHKDLLVSPSPLGQWIGFPKMEDTPPNQDTLFVIHPMPQFPHRVWVVLASVAPARTTVFWLQQDKSCCQTGLVYDTFNKGAIRSAPYTSIGAVTAVSIGEKGAILLKEWRERGSGPHGIGLAGSVYEVDTKRGDVRLKTEGTFVNLRPK